jgi:hypothetical protein
MEYEEPITLIDAPSDNDIIAGRGRGAWLHPGNKKMKRVIEAKLEQYDRATRKKEKIDIINEIHHTMIDRGARYLQQRKDGNQWYEIGKAEAREKTAQAVRGFFKRWKESTRANKSLANKSPHPNEMADKSIILQGQKHLAMASSVASLLADKESKMIAEAKLFHRLFPRTGSVPTMTNPSPIDSLLMQAMHRQQLIDSLLVPSLGYYRSMYPMMEDPVLLERKARLQRMIEDPVLLERDARLLRTLAAMNDSSIHLKMSGL